MTPDERRAALLRGWLTPELEDPPATGVHVPDAFTREVAARLPWSYTAVHAWLGELAELGVPAAGAELVLSMAAHARLSPALLIADHRRINRR